MSVEPTDGMTPRTRLYMQKRRSAQIIVDVMTCLDAQKVASIQREFAKHPENAVDVKEFVRIMEDHLSNFGALRKEMYQAVERNDEEVDEVTRADLLLNLRELFDEIDINGDKLMEWNEFTAFISEKAGLTNAIGLDAITEYREALRDPSSRRPRKRSKPLQHCYYVQPLDAIAGYDDHSPAVQLFSAENGLHVGELRSPEVTGMPTAIEYVGKPIVSRYQEPGVLTVACADSSIVSWVIDPRSKTNKRQFSVNTAWPTPHTQMSLHWIHKHDLLFSGSVAGTVHAWDVEKRDEVTCLIGHTDMVLGLESLPSIESVVSCSLDTTISVWDILTGARRQLLQGHKMGVTSVAYHDQRRLLFSAGFDHEALVWSPFTPTVLFKLKGHGSPLVGVEVVPDSNQVVTADTDGLYKIWDVRTFQCVQSFNMDQGSNPTDEGFVATGMGGGGNAPEDDDFLFTDYQKLYDFTTCHHRPRHLSENATDRLAGASLRLAFFEQRPVNVDTGGADDLPVRCAIYNSVLLSVLTAHGTSVKIWSALTGSLSREFNNITQNGSDITAICLDDRQRKFIIGDHLGDIQVHNYQSGALMKCFDPHSSQVSALIYLNDVKQVVSTSWDGAIVVHDENPADHGLIVRSMDSANTHRGDITCTAVSLQQTMIATGAADKTVRIWDLGTGKILEVLHFEYEINNVIFLEPFPLIIIADTIGWLHLYGVHGSRFKYNSPVKFRHLFRHKGAKVGSDDMILGGYSSSDMTVEAEQEQKNFSDMSTPVMSPVLALEWHADHYILYTGGDRGQIAAWDLAPALRELGKFDPAFRGVSMKQQKKISVIDEGEGKSTDKTEGKVREESKSGEISSKTETKMPSPHSAEGKVSNKVRSSSFSAPAVVGQKNKYNVMIEESTCQLLWTVAAHRDSVSSLHLIEESRSNCSAALLSASYDHTVRIWGTEADKTGVRLGSLLQGIRGRKRHPKWDFHVDVEGIEKREAQEIQNLTKAVATRRDTLASITSMNSSMAVDVSAPPEADASAASEKEYIPPPWRKAEISQSQGVRAQAKLGELEVGNPPPSEASQGRGRRRRSSSASLSSFLEVPDHPDDYDQAAYEQFKTEWFADHPRKKSPQRASRGQPSSGRKTSSTTSRLNNSPKFKMADGVRNPYRDIGKGSKRAAKVFDEALAVAAEAQREGKNSYSYRDTSAELLKLNRMRKRGGGMSLLRAKIAQYGFDSDGNDILYDS